MLPVLIQLIQVMSPIVLEVIQHYQEQHNGETPTAEQLQEFLLDPNVQKVIAEGEAWKQDHPLPPLQ